MKDTSEGQGKGARGREEEGKKRSKAVTTIKLPSPLRNEAQGRKSREEMSNGQDLRVGLEQAGVGVSGLNKGCPSPSTFKTQTSAGCGPWVGISPYFLLSHKRQTTTRKTPRNLASLKDNAAASS
jgi:hypothetical protein